ncbi:MAG: hypothetical protein CVT88_00975 [Candidatus Altiarchaeales archaeon HGW-Altiarchaeales-1]|nr:MAG: hypothetical protein CVT88_00975 [Candidatus Altiarchaeales archaeon HGW-Altiarchaeales-1]
MVTFNVSYLYEINSIDELSMLEEKYLVNSAISSILTQPHKNLTLKDDDCKFPGDRKIVCEINTTKFNFSYKYWFYFNMSSTINLEHDQNLKEVYRISVSDINGTLHRSAYNYSHLFDLESDYEYFLKNDKVDKNLINAFNNRSASLSDIAMIYKIDEKNWEVYNNTDDFYKIEHSGEQLRIYKYIKINDSVIANISGKITDKTNRENPCIFEVYKGICQKIVRPVQCNINMKFEGDLNGSFRDYPNRMKIEGKSCTYFGVYFDLQGTNFFFSDHSKNVDIRYTGFEYLSTNPKISNMNNTSVGENTTTENNTNVGSSNLTTNTTTTGNTTTLNTISGSNNTTTEYNTNTTTNNNTATNTLRLYNSTAQNLGINNSTASNSNISKTDITIQFNADGHIHEDILFHWTLFFLTILSFLATILKLQKYKQGEKKINPDLVGFIFSIIADFHYIPAIFILITAPLLIGEIKLLVVGALLANLISLSVISYELIIIKTEKKEE